MDPYKVLTIVLKPQLLVIDTNTIVEVSNPHTPDVVKAMAKINHSLEEAGVVA